MLANEFAIAIKTVIAETLGPTIYWYCLDVFSVDSRMHLRMFCVTIETKLVKR